MQAITVSDDYFPAVPPRHRLHPPLDLSRRDAALQPGDRRPRRRSAGLRAETPFAFGRDYARDLPDLGGAARGAAATRLTALGYGGPTLRHWRYYLEACAACFAVGRTDVVQVELSHA